MVSSERQARLNRAFTALQGLWVGDCFGGMYFVTGAEEMVEHGLLFAPEWDYTDNSLMAFSVFACLQQFGQLDQEWLGMDFAKRYTSERGYGPSMNAQLQSILVGKHWQEAATEQFEGQGSFGNGAAMRIAPLGAYFADDLSLCVEQARLSSEVTHAHPEGIAGGIAVAVATAQAVCFADVGQRPTRSAFIDSILPWIPDSEVKVWCTKARDLAPDSSLQFVAAVLGTGIRVSAQDTVPFCLWAAGEQLGHYEEALWLTLSGMGDRDTTCAIVGGIVAAYNGEETIPETWRQSCEPLPAWVS